MSVILDALRKLDREKSSHKKKTANIAVDILRSDSIHRRRRISTYLLIVAGAAVAASAITYGVMAEFGYLSKSSAPATKPAPAQQVAIVPSESAVPSRASPPTTVNPPLVNKQAAAPVASAPLRNVQEEKIHVSPTFQSSTEKKERAEVKIPVEPKAPVETKTTIETKTPAVTKTPIGAKTPVAPIVEKKESQNITPKQLDPPPKKTIEPAPNLPTANPASLKLSAIAWFEDPSRRFAMINGIIATEGSSVEGIKVVEINPTSVRLLHDGQYFEISMSK